MPPPDPLKPFDSARLCFRAVRPVEDLPLFIAIADDQAGFANSNSGNIELPGPAQSEGFAKHLAEESFLGAVIWLKPEHGQEQQGAGALGEDGKKEESGDEGVLKSKWGTAIGEIHLSGGPKKTAHHRATELGIDILPAYQGKGYGAEAISWALDYAFRRAGLHRVRVRALEWNEGAMKLYERLGFKLEGREREGMWHEGRWWDVVEYSMLEGEWWEMERAKEGEKKKVVEM
jgi:RimJ/RimL family protein N-acetyltransferase